MNARTILFATLALSACAGRSKPAFDHALPGGALPWTHANFDTAGSRFTFAIVSDLNGGERRDVFSTAVRQLALLRPELVMSVGDLIDGPSPNADSLTREWDDFDARARAMPAPFFRVGGNHDLTGDELRDVWRSRYGPTYYSFVYKDALFLVLDTEDLSPERAREIFVARTKAVQAAAENQGGQDTLSYYRMQERATGDISAAQAAYMRRAIAEHADVRWTFVFLHKPVWGNPADDDFKAIERALADRPYTVFSGHLHSLALRERLGREYYTLGTTGGSQNPRDPMAFDHLTLVTMTKDGPSVTHLRMEGVLGPDGKLPSPRP
ncbi:MAG: hypothetical protein C0503_01160 [Gemmatimonas sp.]|nr:hypothetical protein [Gemmatimonas sp.]